MVSAVATVSAVEAGVVVVDGGAVKDGSTEDGMAEDLPLDFLFLGTVRSIIDSSLSYEDIDESSGSLHIFLMQV